MAAALNEVNLLGNIGQDAEYKYFKGSDTHMTVLSICTEDLIVLRNGHTKKEKDWHRVVLWGDNAIEAKNHKKGDQLFIIGKLKNIRYTNEQGIEQFRIEVVAHTCIDTTDNFEADGHMQNGGFSEDPLKPNNKSGSITYA